MKNLKLIILLLLNSLCFSLFANPSLIALKELHTHNLLNKSFLLSPTNNKDVLLERSKIELLTTNNEIAKSVSASNKVAIKVNILAIIAIAIPAVEFKLANNFSLQLQALGVHQPKGFIGTDKPISLGAFFIEPRYYFSKTFQGFFIGLNTGIGYYNMAKQIIPNYWSEAFNNVEHKGWNIMGGMSMGYFVNLSPHIAIEPYITTGYTYAQYDNYTNDILTTANKTTSRFVYAYNGGLNIIYKIGKTYTHNNRSENISKQYYNTYHKQYRGSRYNKRVFKKLYKLQQ